MPTERTNASQTFAALAQRAIEIRTRYDEHNIRLNRPEWGPAEYVQGLMGDMGTLAKLVMASNGLRDEDDLHQRLAHELADCLWSVIVIADALDIDLESAFESTMSQLETRLS